MTQGYQYYLELAEHYVAIGQTEISLYNTQDLPWDSISHVESVYADCFDGNNRLRVYSKPMGSYNLVFHWTVDVLEWAHDFDNSYKVNHLLLEKLLSKLSLSEIEKVHNHLRTTIDEADKEITKQLKYIQSMAGAAHLLELLIETHDGGN